ncbi:MAG: outer membrane protein assembly factor BamD [Alphaproteobacteria bacterium]|nr:MAG: outer membrane protein assembly factor BamD [Alphaproteobacteria bacterium]
MRRDKRLVHLFGVIAVAAALAGCGRREPAMDTLTPQEIYLRGEEQLAAGREKDAATTFAEIERLYPYSEWAKRALIMTAFAYHKAKDYENARAAAQRYIDFYPADEDAAYAQYLLALSYYDQIDDVGRDQGVTYQALQALRTVIERYPDSDYARSAMLKFDMAFDQLAAKEMEVGRYYLKRGHYAAAINRFRAVVEDFETTTQTPEALYRLVEAYLSLGLEKEAQTAAAILGYNFQSSVWYQDAYDLLQGRGLKPAPKATGWIADIYRRSVQGKWL